MKKRYGKYILKNVWKMQDKDISDIVQMFTVKVNII